MSNHHRRRPVRRMTAVLLAFAAALLLMAAGQAQAAEYATGGAPGKATEPAGHCTLLFGSGNLEITAPPPTILARNNTAGYGNDAQWVRYRVFLVDANTGATVASSGYSGYGLAYDNQAPAFSGSTTWTANGARSYKIQYRVEWMTGNTVSGWSALQTDFYYYTRRYNMGYSLQAGALTTCYAKYQ